MSQGTPDPGIEKRQQEIADATAELRVKQDRAREIAEQNRLAEQNANARPSETPVDYGTEGSAGTLGYGGEFDEVEARRRLRLQNVLDGERPYYESVGF